MQDRDPLPITTPPARDQLISHQDKIYTTVKEGKAHILVPPNARTSLDQNVKTKPDDEQKVFYNPIQQFNRDLSVLAIKAYGGDLCRRKSMAREIKKKKEGEKRERKKQKQAQASAGGDQNGLDTTDGARSLNGETIEVDLAASSKKRKRTDDGEAEIEGQVGKAQKGGNSSDSHGDDTLAAPADVSVNGKDNSWLVDSSSDAAAGIDARNTSTSVNETENPEPGSKNEAQQPTTEPKPWQPSFRILDALSATGLRALRYATEIPTATAIVANDRDRGATAAIALNVQHNDLTSKITTSTGDAMGHMYAAAFPPPNSHGPHHISGKYDVIDLDPYGTAAPFIDAALQALNDEGLLCVTCTDSGVFASCGYSEKTFALYGGMPVKGPHAHEGGVRLIIHSIATAAAKYSLAIEPLLSLSIDFYARVFIRVRKSAADVKFLAGKTMLVYECDVGCGAWSTQFLGRHQRHGKGENSWKYHISMGPTSDRLCEHCGSKMHVVGPMWGGPLHNAAFIEKILEDVETADKEVYLTLPRIEGMLDTALGELLVISEILPSLPHTSTTTNPSSSTTIEAPLIPPTPPHILDPHPFYFTPSALCKVIKAVAPPEAAIRGALRRLGYAVTRSHAKAGSLKTDAPWNVIWEVMREWVRQWSPVKGENLRVGGPGWNILGGMRGGWGKGVGVGRGGEDGGTASSRDGGAGAANGAAAGDGEDIAMPPRPPAGEAEGNVETPSITTETPTIDSNTIKQPVHLSIPPQSEPGKVLDVHNLEIVFDEKLGQDQGSGRLRKRKGGDGKKRLVRYQQNPRENWGPMARARGGG